MVVNELLEIGWFQWLAALFGSGYKFSGLGVG
jgi:hypothetical protein